MKKVKVRVPSGKAVIREIRGKTAHVKCASCGKVLHGIPRGTSSQVRKFARSEMRVSRKFGGHFCSECTREYLRMQARQLQ